MSKTPPLRLAQHLLIRSTVPMADVADRAGFASPCRFSHFFRRQTDSTPRDFRKAFRPF